MKRLYILLIAIVLGVKSYGFVKLPDILSSGMVLQRNTAVPIWGTALPGEDIKVTFGSQLHQTKADMSGNWKIFLDPLEASATGQTLLIQGINAIHLKDVVVGEVWLCAGQSNMQLVLPMTNKGDSVIASANYPMLHLFNVSRENSFGHTRGAIGTWEPCTPQSVKEFSAAGYYFGLGLEKQLKVPVGIINASFGGSQAEAWTPREYLRTPALQPCIDRDTMWASQRANVQVSYAKELEDWRAYAEKEKAAGRKPKEAPHQPEALRDYRPTSSIYNHMVQPLIPYQIKGVFWYQGENNEGRAEQYRSLLPAMIQSWRDKWGYELPFGIIQLPNYRDKSQLPVDGAWSFLRDAQRRTSDSLAKTGLIVLIDAGEAHNIHPHNKQIVGERMLTWALGAVYGQNILPSGPRFIKATYSGKTVTVDFDQVGKGLKTVDGKLPQSFALAGADHKWYWGEAKIINTHQIRVTSKEVKKPIAVRYAFNNNPDDPNLTNDSNIPASPFRSDDWPGPTQGKR
ncbi:sialate O-acetylesterase [Arachidicoccus rhizosphaerae]|uniref:Sialate O-acetylesterase n=1 Tax=Arachidicoccus rhizosphaerae TaxID=551991 RepID=A0A1H3VRG1_9BACT|nr:sialate O-acetylesterase [Arachidicoccus rhizosphaerae]SDZ76712.1 sialate O-acetylesterase [Arachidicoccus rhizosphaerae]